MWYSIVEMCMGFIKLQHKSSVFWVIVHVGIVRQMGRHIIASSCSHYCGAMQAETAGSAREAAQSCSSCRNRAQVKGQLRWVSAGQPWKVSRARTINKQTKLAVRERGREREGGTLYQFFKWLLPALVCLMRPLTKANSREEGIWFGHKW